MKIIHKVPYQKSPAKIKLRVAHPPMPMPILPCQELTEFQKGQIDGAARFGHTATEIHKVLGYARSTIHDIITHIKNRGFSENKQRVGRPRKSIDRDNRLLI